MVRHFPTQREHRVTETSVYRALFATDGLSKNQLVERLGGSRSSISRLLDSLEQQGAVERSSDTARAGRSEIYVVSQRSVLSLGAFIGPNAYGVGLVDASGGVMDRVRGDIEKHTTPEDVATSISNAVDRILERNGIDRKKEILGIGLSAVGPLWKRRGVMVRPFHLVAENWNYVPIGELVAFRTGLPTTIDTVAEAALFAEVVFGAARESQSVAYVWFDEGIGTSLYANGLLGVGEADLSYTLGHLVIELEGKQCVCGRRGCLETYASLPAIHDEVVARFQAEGLVTPPTSSTQLSGAYSNRSGETDASDAYLNRSSSFGALSQLTGRRRDILEAVIDDASRAVAVALTNFVHLTQPRLLLFGGKTIDAFPGLVRQLPDHIGQLQYDSYQASCEVEHCRFTDETVIVGSALLPVNNYVGLVDRSVPPGVFDFTGQRLGTNR